MDDLSLVGAILATCAALGPEKLASFERMRQQLHGGKALSAGQRQWLEKEYAYYVHAPKATKKEKKVVLMPEILRVLPLQPPGKGGAVRVQDRW